MWRATWREIMRLWREAWQALHNGADSDARRGRCSANVRLARRRAWREDLFGGGASRPEASGSKARRRRMSLERCERREVFSADLSLGNFVDSTFEFQSPWQNPALAADVVPDAVLAPSDLLSIVNALADGGERALATALATGDGALQYLDANGDQQLSLADFDFVLSALESLPSAVSSAAADFSPAPAMSDSTVADDVLPTIDDLAPTPSIPSIDELAQSEMWPTIEDLAPSDSGPTIEDLAPSSTYPTIDDLAPSADVASSNLVDSTAPPPAVSTETVQTQPAPSTVAPPGSTTIPPNLVLPPGSTSIPPGTKTICLNVPNEAGPTPTMIVDVDANVHIGSWRPAWTTLDDLANEGLIIDDFNSPYVAPGNVGAYTDDNSKVAPNFVDAPFVDDSHFAWLEIVGYRTYYVGTLVTQFANTTPVTQNTTWEQTVSYTVGSTVTNTITAQVGAELGAELEGVGSKLQGMTSAGLSVSTQQQSTIQMHFTENIEVPACSVVGLYAMTKVVEVQVDYAYMEDTTLGPMYGYTREMGRGVIRSTTNQGYRAMQKSGTIFVVPAP